MDFFSRCRKKKITADPPSDDDVVETLAIGLAMEFEESSSNHGYGERRYIDRNTLLGHERLFHDYFSDNPMYSAELFRRRFRMSRSLFNRIQTTIEANTPYFQQRRNAARKLGLSSIQKITAALRMLAYGVSADFMDEYIRIGETTALESLKLFVKSVICFFGKEYSRSPIADDLTRLLAIGEARGFPGMLGSIDCMHWMWKNCPSAWKGMYSGHVHEPTTILEAVASYDLWIWHAFFGMPGSHNDINVLERSNVFQELAMGRAPAVNYFVNDRNYTMGYYLADGIYPSWATFVKTIPAPRTRKHRHFAKCQESTRKDLERAFGVLQARFAIICAPARFLHTDTLDDIMTACIILHNMIVEYQRDSYQQLDLTAYEQINESPPLAETTNNTGEVMNFIQCHHLIRDREVHNQLQIDLIDHVWNLHSDAS